MYQRALQSDKKAISPDDITTYISALNTFLNFGLLFEYYADLAKASTMFSKALRKYKKVFGFDYVKSKTLWDKLCALNTVLKNKGPVEIKEYVEELPTGSSLDNNKPPLISKRHKLFRKLGLRSCT